MWKNPSKNTRIWDVRFLLSYLPPLSYFVRFCLTPQPPLKSDIIYVCSLEFSSKLHYFTFFSEPILPIEKDPNYNVTKSNTARENFKKTNFSPVFRAHLEEIDFSPDGEFFTTLNDEMEKFTTHLTKKFGRVVQSIERLIVQYVAMLANWR